MNRTGYSRSAIRQHALGRCQHDIDEPPADPDSQRRGPDKYTDEEIREALRSAAEAQDEPLTKSKYRAWQSEGSPVSRTITTHLGSWVEACESAGVTPGSVGEGLGGPIPRSYETEEILRRIAAAFEDAPSTTEYQHRASESPELPALSTVYRHFDSWRDMLFALNSGDFDRSDDPPQSTKDTQPREELLCPHCEEPASALIKGYEYVITRQMSRTDVCREGVCGPTYLHVRD